MQNIWRNKRGTSLVEILVVMVVLLVGILTIIQMFPTGFRVVRAGESQSIATRLAEQELERWKSMAANLPAGIVPAEEGFPAGGSLIDSKVKPFAPFEAYLPNSSGGWQTVTIDGPGGTVTRLKRGNAFCFRQILGETTAIPNPVFFSTGDGTQFGSRYTLAFSPIDVSRAKPTDPTSELVGLVVKGGDLKRRIYSGTNPPSLKPGNYAVDYTIRQGSNSTPVFWVAFPRDKATTRKFYINYSYWVDDNGAQRMVSVVDVPIDASSTNTYGWNEVDVPAEAITVEPNSDTCARAFLETSTFTSDPYQFKLADPILGVISFNPCGNGLYEYTAYGLKPLKASIDYRIYDSRIIHEDRVVPQRKTGANGTSTMDSYVKLSLRFILNIGDPTDDPLPSGSGEAMYHGLVENSPMGSLPLPIYIIDLATGLQVSLPTNYTQDTAAGGLMDYKAGVVRLPETAPLVDWNGATITEVILSGRHLRFFYRADGDWSVQCQKAYSHFTRVYDADKIDYRSYMLTAPNRLVFAICQAEQTVAVDYTYAPIGSSSEGDHKTISRSFQIQLDTTTDEWCVDLPLPEDMEIKRLAVTGTSFRVRVLWRDEKNWRHVDLDTTLTRE